jgi:hypothetical protein
MISIVCHPFQNQFSAMEGHMNKCMLLVLTNPIEGKEQEFNEWYTSQHIRDILKVGGVVAAQRFRFLAGKGGFGYLALYELETDDPEAVLATIRERDKNGTHLISEAVNRNDVYAGLFEAITERMPSMTSSA